MTDIKLSILFPAYNESAIISDSVHKLRQYMQDYDSSLHWELVIVNDGSADDTGKIADELAGKFDNIIVVHHKKNRNLGSALCTGFELCRGYYVIVLDIDLSYAPWHIEKLIERAESTDADLVVASPYMKGGRNTAVPTGRLILSKTINRMIRAVSPVPLSTFTGMVRLYKKSFLSGLNLKSTSYAINPEIIQKAAILRARIEEIPAHLDWSYQNKTVARISSVRIVSGIFSGLMTSFIFRPYAFFIIMGSALLLVSLYIITWIFVNTFAIYPEFAQESLTFKQIFTRSVAHVFNERPHSFIVGSTALIISLQLLSLGFLSLQSKRYFDELFNITSKLLGKAE